MSTENKTPEKEALDFANKAHLCTHSGIYGLALDVFQQRDEARTEVTQLTNRANDWKACSDEYRRQRDDLLSDVDRLTKERDKLRANFHQACEDYETVRDELATLRATHQNHGAAIEAVSKCREWIQSDLSEGGICVRAELERRIQYLTDVILNSQQKGGESTNATTSTTRSRREDGTGLKAGEAEFIPERESDLRESGPSGEVEAISSTRSDDGIQQYSVRTDRGVLNASNAAPTSEPEGAAILDRETLGRMVRRVWIDWAKEQPAPKSSWLVEWDELSESDKEVDRRIGETIAWTARIHGVPSLTVTEAAKEIMKVVHMIWTEATKNTVESILSRLLGQRETELRKMKDELERERQGSDSIAKQRDALRDNLEASQAHNEQLRETIGRVQDKRDALAAQVEELKRDKELFQKVVSFATVRTVLRQLVTQDFMDALDAAMQPSAEEAK